MCGMFIGRKDDLFVVVAHRVEEVEEFLLGFFSVRDELHVVHDEHVVLAVLVFEVVGVPRAHRVDVIDGETLGGNVENFFIRGPFLEVVADRLNEVRFAHAGIAVYEERIVDLPRALDDRLRGRMGELVERTDDKSFESIFKRLRSHNSF